MNSKIKKAGSVLKTAIGFFGKVVGAFLLVILPLGFFQVAVDKHWLLGFLLLPLFGFGVYQGIDDYKRDGLDRWQGIVTLCCILVMTIAVFGYLSFVLNRFGLAHYEGFPPKVVSEPKYVLQTLINVYIWELFELIPGVRINEAFGSGAPLRRSGFWASLLVLSFRVVMIFIVLDVFRKWWQKKQSA